MVSIAMAVYNGERFLRGQLDSILRQTYQDFEVVICDDCSTDGSCAIIQEYATKDPRIKLHKNEANLDYIKNFEKAVKLCQGEYVAFCDQDDIWSENHIEVLMKAIGDKDLACGRELRFENDSDIAAGNLVDTWKAIDFVFPKDEKSALLYLFCSSSFFSGNAMLFKKSFFENERLFPFPAAHDYWLGVCSIVAGNGFCQVENVITYRRYHRDNVSCPGLRPSLLTKIRNTLLLEKDQARTDRKVIFQEIENRFSFKPTLRAVLEQCKVFLQGRVCSIFSIRKKLKGLVVYMRNFNQITSREETKDFYRKAKRKAFFYFRYLFF